MGCSLIEKIVFIFSSRLFRQRKVFQSLIKVSRFWYQIRGKTLNFDANRFEKSSWVSSPREKKAGYKSKSIELVVVSTSKDFAVLKHSVTYALRAIGDYNSGGVRIIVPEKDLGECKRLFSKTGIEIKVINENTLVSKNQFSALSQYFSLRDTWVLQQLLKVQAVLTSEADAVLILDSDTLLLRKRPWFDQNARQILTPTYEFNAPYYLFLNKLISTEKFPDYTFVSHHMIIQPNILKQIFDDYKLLNLDNLIHFCCIHADKSVQSPICIEYELYGQYLASRNKNKAFFALWSNATIPKRYFQTVIKSKLIRFLLTRMFNSISFHSWS